MSEAGDYDLKRCAKCAAWIPRIATMCAYCGTTSPDEPPARPSGLKLSVRRGFSVTTILIWANALYLLWFLFVQVQARGGNVLQYLLTGANFRALELGWYDHFRVVDGDWWRVMTATFLHAGAIHIGFNMMALHQLGRLAEQIFGPAKFLAIYLICGVCSMAAVSIWFVYILHQGAHIPVVGASGAIFGVAGMLTAFLLRRGTEHGRAIGMMLARNLLFMLGLGVLIQFVSNTGHVGGLIPGLLFGLFVRTDFGGRIDPTARRVWTFLAVAGIAITAVALFAGVRNSLDVLGGAR